MRKIGLFFFEQRNKRTLFIYEKISAGQFVYLSAFFNSSNWKINIYKRVSISRVMIAGYIKKNLEIPFVVITCAL